MKWLALSLIRLYQRTVSQVLPPSCRFVPSCSEYGHEAIERYGVIRGGIIATWRVLRCNPWGGHGYDPVPELHHHTTQTQSTVNATALTPNAPGHSLTEG
jgi:putative membrane protein insertion efficiency factor